MPAARPWPSIRCSRPAPNFWAIGAACDRAHFPGRHAAASGARRQGGLCPGGRAISQHRASAVQNVADTLAALEQDAQALKTAAAAADAAKVTLDLSQRQLKDGYASYLSLLGAEQTYQQARINARAGPGESLRRHRCALPGAGRWMVAARGFSRRIEMTMKIPKLALANCRGVRPAVRRLFAQGRQRPGAPMARCQQRDPDGGPTAAISSSIP